jgi:hypothetical protein
MPVINVRNKPAREKSIAIAQKNKEKICKNKLNSLTVGTSL